MNYLEPIIGLEIHIELSTKSKMFCACSADYFGAKPNTHICPICLGLPGALPKANRLAIEYTLKLGMALSCQSQMSSKFDRKNYFYPDLPKGYQISQFDMPFSQKGYLEIQTDGAVKRIGITRVHLEEDTGKLSHAIVNGRRVTLIDFNRSGVPLVEVVSEPQINSAQEAKVYAQKLQQIVRYLKISDADMEKGSMRIEPNVSLRKRGDKNIPHYKVELKNINSFKFAEKAINFEIERQEKILESGITPDQETRGWDEKASRTISQRSKELAHDYRYFPEPDLVPFIFTKDYFQKLTSELPELPDKKRARFKKGYQLTDYDIEILTREKDLAEYFEEAAKIGIKHTVTPKQVANAIINKKPNIATILPAKLIQKIISQTKPPTIGQEELEKIIKQILLENSKAVSDYRSGREEAIQFLIGQVMHRVKKKINFEIIHKIMEEKLNAK